MGCTAANSIDSSTTAEVTTTTLAFDYVDSVPPQEETAPRGTILINMFGDGVKNENGVDVSGLATKWASLLTTGDLEKGSFVDAYEFCIVVPMCKTITDGPPSVAS